MLLDPHIYLNSGLGEGSLRSEALPRRHARVMALLELLLQLFQLIRTEGGPVPTKLRLLGTVQARVVLVGVGGRAEHAVLGVGGAGRGGRGAHRVGGRPGRLQPQGAVGPEGRVPGEGGRGVRVVVVEAVAGGAGEFGCRPLGRPVAQDPVDAADGRGGGVRADT